jgi:hypothetical protein
MVVVVVWSVWSVLGGIWAKDTEVNLAMNRNAMERVEQGYHRDKEFGGASGHGWKKDTDQTRPNYYPPT